MAAGPYDRRAIERRDDVCTYTTPPLSSSLALAGPVRAELTLATDAPDTDVVATLVHRTDDVAYTLAGFDECATGGVGTARCRFRTGRYASPSTCGTYHRVPAGDRLRLEVASSDAPRFDPHPGTRRPWEATDEAVRPNRRSFTNGTVRAR